jgi:hypothetical protein
MRTTTRLCLVVSVIAAFALASVPIAEAAKNRPGSVRLGQASNLGKAAYTKKEKKKENKQNKRIEKAHNRIENLKQWNFESSDWNNSQQKQIESLQSTVNTIVAGVPAIVQGLTDLKAALEGPVASAFADIEDGFAEVSDALNDTTTGLVGLNLRAPNFGVFLGDGTFQGGTGPVNGTGPTNPPFGPEGNAFVVPATDGTYVVDFIVDVSTRVYNVQPFPTGGLPLVPSAVSCLTPGAHQAACDAAPGGAGNRANKVFVLLQTGAGAPTDGAFSVTAFSG